MEMGDALIFLLIGLVTAVAGVLVLKRDNRLFAEAVQTHATVVSYDEYQNTSGRTGTPRHMYTMVVSYDLPDGTLVTAREQSGSSNRKFPVGQDIQILYSPQKTDFFVRKGDYSRKIALWGMIVVGSLMTLGALVAMILGT